MAREASEGSSSSDEEAGCDKPKGAERALQAFKRGHRRMRQRPLKHVRRYVREAEEFLGVSPGVPYNLADYTRRISWGRHKTLQRCLSLKEKPTEAALQVILSLRCLRQCSTDNGEWGTAWLLTGLPDPYRKPRFGGEHQQLEEVAGYVKAMVELEKKARQYSTLPGADQAEEPAEPKTYNPKSKKWQKGAQVRAGDKPVE